MQRCIADTTTTRWCRNATIWQHRTAGTHWDGEFESFGVFESCVISLSMWRMWMSMVFLWNVGCRTRTICLGVRTASDCHASLPSTLSIGLPSNSPTLIRRSTIIVFYNSSRPGSNRLQHTTSTSHCVMITAFDDSSNVSKVERSRAFLFCSYRSIMFVFVFFL